MNGSELTTTAPRNLLRGGSIFLSASFPRRDRSPAYYDTANPDEITQALVACCRAIFSSGGRVVFGGHPSVTPLVMMIAKEYLPESLAERLAERERRRSLVVAYQSEAFRAHVPESTWNLERWGFGEIRWTPGSDVPQFSPSGTLSAGSAEGSLLTMRRRMLEDLLPIAALFIGGMDGIMAEADLFQDICRASPRYFIGAPGGAARELAHERNAGFSAASGLAANDLLEGRSYPALFQRIVLDIAARTAGH